jgi:PKD repeat protein
MNIKQKMFFALISIVLLSATALAASTTHDTNAKALLKTPVAAFSASPTSGYAPLKVVFTDKSAGKPTSWKWNFGDGTSLTTKNPTHKYTKAGKYTVTLTVKNIKGNNKITKYGYITVLAPLKAPVAAFTASPTSGYSPLKVVFTDKSTGSPTSWNWNFGDGTSSTVKNTVHTYNKEGKYTVTLTVKNAKGNNKITRYNFITVDSATVVDVVCEMKIDKRTAEFKSEYKGETYYFCSVDCKTKFDENPVKYINS